MKLFLSSDRTCLGTKWEVNLALIQDRIFISILDFYTVIEKASVCVTLPFFLNLLVIEINL